jgi:hypothetical protein
MDRLDPGQGPRIDAGRDLAAEEQLDAPGHDDRIEGRIRDESAQLVRDHDEGALAVAQDLDAAALHRRRLVAREAVEGLVVVVVRVEGPGIGDPSLPPGCARRRAGRR